MKYDITVTRKGKNPGTFVTIDRKRCRVYLVEPLAHGLLLHFHGNGPVRGGGIVVPDTKLSRTLLEEWLDPQPAGDAE